MSSSKDWLKDVKAGDHVYCRNGYMGTIFSIEVEKVTATQIVCGTRRYNRETGYLLGYNGYHRPYLVEATQQIKDLVRADDISASLTNILRGKTSDNVALLLYLGDALEAYESKRNTDSKEGSE